MFLPSLSFSKGYYVHAPLKPSSCLALIVRSSPADIANQRLEEALTIEYSHAATLSDVQQAVDARWPLWSKEGYSLENLLAAPSVADCAAQLIATTYFLRKFPPPERYFQVSHCSWVAACVDRICIDLSALGNHEAQLQNFDASALASLISAICIIGGPSTYCNEVEALLMMLEPKIEELSPKHIAPLVHGLGGSKHWTPLLNRLSQQAAARARSITPQLLQPLLWGFACLNSLPTHLLSRGVVQTKHVRKLSQGSLVNCMWSMAVLNKTEHRLFGSLWHELSAREENRNHPLSTRMLMQLHQAGLAAKHERSTDLPHFPLLEEAEAVWHATKDLAVMGSFYQKDISSCLTSLGLAHRLEDMSWDTRVDIYIPDRGLAIEADGPSHFTRTSHQLMGPTAFKHRLLRAMGCRVLSVSHFDWDALPDRAAQRAFLKKAIEVAK